MEKWWVFFARIISIIFYFNGYSPTVPELHPAYIKKRLLELKQYLI